MGARRNYLSIANNSYRFFVYGTMSDEIYNDVASMAQNTCERYLKALITIGSKHISNKRVTMIIREHSLRALCEFMLVDCKLIADKDDVWDVLRADKYYINSRYPDGKYISPTKEDIKICSEVLSAARRIVAANLKTNEALNWCRTNYP